MCLKLRWNQTEWLILDIEVLVECDCLWHHVKVDAKQLLVEQVFRVPAEFLAVLKSRLEGLGKLSDVRTRMDCFFDRLVSSTSLLLRDGRGEISSRQKIIKKSLFSLKVYHKLRVVLLLYVVI